jgi:hypothetical protein
MLLDKVPTGQGFHMFTDRYYTSIELAQELLKLKCYLTGTIKTNRKGLPVQIKKPKFTTTKKTMFCRKNNILLAAWKDKRVVTLLSTKNKAGVQNVSRIIRGGHVEEFQKPNVVLDYTKYMGGVDRADHYAASYCFLGKSFKWRRKLFFWGLEVCAVNSYILYKEKCKEKTRNP